MITGCTTINVTSQGNVAIDAHKEVVTGTDVGVK